MASVPFHILKLGAEKIPDKAFEKIPYAGPRYFKEKEEHEERKHDRERKDRDRDRDRGQKDRDRNRDDRDRRDRDRNDRDRRKKDRRRRDDRDSDSESYDSYSDSDRSPRSSRAPRKHHRSARKERRDERPDRGYESDPQSPGIRGYNEAPYFPPPPRIAVNEHQEGQRNVGEGSAGYVPRPYDPNEYGERPGSRDSYYAGHPQEQQPFSTVPPPAGIPQQPMNPAPGSSTNDPDYHSSAADRYRPANYDQSNRNISPGSYDPYPRNVSPTAQQNRGSPNPTYPSALTLHPQNAQYDPYPQYEPGYNTYQPPSDEGDEPRHRRRRSRSGSRSPSRSRSRSRNNKRQSRSRSRVGGATDKAKQGFEKHKKELGVSALGALAGGIIGNEFGGKKGSMGMLIGAALGGLGGGFYEKNHSGKKARMKAERRNSRHSSQDGYDSY